MQHIGRALAPLAGAALALGLAATPAMAHAKYDHSGPAAGATVSAAPSTVTVVFGEEPSVTQSTLMVFDANGARVDASDGKVDTSDPDRKTMKVSLKSGLGDGVYTVKYHTVTEDDHGVVDGSFGFGVNAAVPAAQAKPSESESGGDEGAAATGPGQLPNSGEDPRPAPALPLLAGVALAAVGVGLRWRGAPRHQRS